MVKALGAMLVIGGGLWWGLSRSRELSRRRAAIEAWAEALALLEGELAFSLPAMPELLEGLSRRSRSPAREALSAIRANMDRLGEKSFSQLWREALEAHGEALAPEDLEQLCRLGGLLSRRGWEDQREAAEAVRISLLAQAEQLREELRREGKSYGTLGLALGAFLTILLM